MVEVKASTVQHIWQQAKELAGNEDLRDLKVRGILKAPHPPKSPDLNMIEGLWVISKIVLRIIP